MTNIKLRNEELTPEELIILSAKPESQKSLESPMHPLLAKTALTNLKKTFSQDKSFYKFCLANMFKMHHRVSYNEVILTLTYPFKTCSYKQLNMEDLDILISRIFFEGPQLAFYVDDSSFCMLQAQVFAALYEDLIDPLFLYEQSEIYLLEYKNENSMHNFHSLMSNLINLSNDNKNFIKTMYEKGAMERIANRLVEDIKQGNEKAKLLFFKLFNIFSFDAKVSAPFVPFFINQISVSEDPSVSFQVLASILKKWEKKYFSTKFNSKDKTQIDNEKDMKEAEIKIELIQKYDLFNLFDAYIKNQVNNQKKDNSKYIFADMLMTIFANFSANKRNASHQIVLQHARPVFEQFIPIFINTLISLDQISEQFQKFLTYIISVLDIPEFKAAIIDTLLTKINLLLDEKDHNKIEILGTYLNYSIKLSYKNVTQNSFFLNRIIKNDNSNIQNQRIDYFFSSIKCLDWYNQKPNSIKSFKLMFMNDFSTYFAFILEDSFIQEIGNENSRYTQLLKKYSNIAVIAFFKECDIPDQNQNQNNILIKIFCLINNYLKFSKFVKFSVKYYPNIIELYENKEQLIRGLITSFNKRLISSGVFLVNKYFFNQKIEICNYAICHYIELAKSTNANSIYENFNIIVPILKEIRNHAKNEDILLFMLNCGKYWRNPNDINTHFDFLKWLSLYLYMFGFEGVIHIRDFFDLNISQFDICAISATSLEIFLVPNIVCDSLDFIIKVLLTNGKMLESIITQNQNPKEFVSKDYMISEERRQFVSFVNSFSSFFVALFRNSLEIDRNALLQEVLQLFILFTKNITINEDVLNFAIERNDEKIIFIFLEVCTSILNDPHPTLSPGEKITARKYLDQLNESEQYHNLFIQMLQEIKGQRFSDLNINCSEDDQYENIDDTDNDEENVKKEDNDSDNDNDNDNDNDSDGDNGNDSKEE